MNRVATLQRPCSTLAFHTQLGNSDIGTRIEVLCGPGGSGETSARIPPANGIAGAWWTCKATVG